MPRGTASARDSARGGAANRIAARRVGRGDRAASRGRDSGKAAGKKSAKAGGRGKKAGAGDPPVILKAMKLTMLLAFMAALGFAVVLVVDVGLTLVGGIHLGNVTFAELADKIEDRFLDRDLPEPRVKAQRAPARAPTTTKPHRVSRQASSTAPSSSPATTPPDRAELPAPPRPDDYVHDVETPPDPEVAQARQRLDRLLGR